MSKYSDKVAARSAAGNALAVAIEIAERPHGVPTPPRRPRTPPPPQRGVLVNLGTMPQNCAAAFDAAAACLERASSIAREMLAHARRSCQSGEATCAALLAETTAPRLRAASVRLQRMPARPKGGAA